MALADALAQGFNLGNQITTSQMLRDRQSRLWSTLGMETAGNLANMSDREKLQKWYQQRYLASHGVTPPNAPGDIEQLANLTRHNQQVSEERLSDREAWNRGITLASAGVKPTGDINKDLAALAQRSQQVSEHRFGIANRINDMILDRLSTGNLNDLPQLINLRNLLTGNVQGRYTGSSYNSAPSIMLRDIGSQISNINRKLLDIRAKYAQKYDPIKDEEGMNKALANDPEFVMLAKQKLLLDERRKGMLDAIGGNSSVPSLNVSIQEQGVPAHQGEVNTGEASTTETGVPTVNTSPVITKDTVDSFIQAIASNGVSDEAVRKLRDTFNRFFSATSDAKVDATALKTILDSMVSTKSLFGTNLIDNSDYIKILHTLKNAGGVNNAQ